MATEIIFVDFFVSCFFFENWFKHLFRIDQHSDTSYMLICHVSVTAHGNYIIIAFA